MKLAPLLLAAGLIAAQLNAKAADLTMALGGFDVRKSGVAMGQAEYRFSNGWSGFRPQAVLFVTEDSGVYLYGGVGYPFALNEQWSLTPVFRLATTTRVMVRTWGMTLSSTVS